MKKFVFFLLAFALVNFPVFLMADGNDIVISGAARIDTENGRRVIVTGNATVEMHGIVTLTRNIGSGAAIYINPGASLHLYLAAGSVSTIISPAGYAGIFVPEGASLTISGTGRLYAAGGGGLSSTAMANTDLGAGIGGNGNSIMGNTTPNAGEIIILGGEIYARGGGNAAGIGGGGCIFVLSPTLHNPGTGGNVTILGGTVTAIGGHQGSTLGIGGGAGVVSGELRGSFVYGTHEIITIPLTNQVLANFGKNTTDIAFNYRFVRLVSAEITTQPQNTSVTHGEITESLTVAVNVASDYTIQWYSNATNSNTDGTRIDGATSATFAVPTDLGEGMHYFYAVISVSFAATNPSNASRMVEVSFPSEVAVVTVEEPPAADTGNDTNNGVFTPPPYVPQVPDTPHIPDTPYIPATPTAPAPVPLPTSSPLQVEDRLNTITFTVAEAQAYLLASQPKILAFEGVEVVLTASSLAAIAEASETAETQLTVTATAEFSEVGFLAINISFSLGEIEVTDVVFVANISFAEFDLSGINTYRIVAKKQNPTILGGVYSAGVFTFEARAAGEFLITYVETLNRFVMQVGAPIIYDLAGNAPLIVMDMWPVITDGRTLIPIRFLAEALGAEIGYSPETYGNPLTVFLSHGAETLAIPVGEITPALDALGMDVPAQIKYDRTMLPLRFVSEFFGAVVGWCEVTQSIEILR
jgi:hypothetical protein